MSQLRQDLISGDWVLVAPGRAARPKFLDTERPARKPSLKSTCVFEEPFLKAHDAWPPKMAFPNEKRWEIIVIPNKFPAVAPGDTCSIEQREGLYTSRTAVGEHDLIVTRDHNKNLVDLTPKLAEQVITTFQMLCKRSAKDSCALYSVPFWNWGVAAGSSVWHPHYQFLSLPIIPAHSARSLSGANAYFKKKHRCGRCDIIHFEQKEKVRVIAENANAIALAPYASKLPFEVRVMPKKHESYFFRSSSKTIRDVTNILQKVLGSMKKNMNDPDLNAFIHEAPLDNKSHTYHHWHIEIIPRVSTPAGFELSTGIYINTAEPEMVARTLRAGK